MKKIILVALLLPCIVSCVSNQSESSENTKLAATSENDLRCENINVLGSHIPKRRCSTKAQRDSEREKGKEYLEEVRKLRELNNALSRSGN